MGYKLYTAYVFPLYPNKEQANLLKRTFGCVRFTYNQLIAGSYADYKRTGEFHMGTPAELKKDHPWLSEVDSQALNQASLHAKRAFRNYFCNPEHFRKPKFKSKKRSRASYTTCNQINKSTGRGTVRFENDCLQLPKVGLVKIYQYRPIVDGGVIKSATVSQTKSGEFLVSLLVEYEAQIPIIVPTKFFGLDFSMPNLFVACNGNTALDIAKEAGLEISDIRFFKQSAQKLARMQRQLSRKKSGGKNYNKQLHCIRLLHEHIAAQRNDFLHKLTTFLARTFDVIGIEDLNLKGMAKRKAGRKFSFGKSITENSWGKFTQMLDYKMALLGKKLVKVGKTFPSSQLCHCCGYRNQQTKDLSVRTWVCPQCGTKHDRDINAAMNIMKEAQHLFMSTPV